LVIPPLPRFGDLRVSSWVVLAGPSAPVAVAGRVEPTIAARLALRVTRLRKESLSLFVS
jgi:hypothetical protein